MTHREYTGEVVRLYELEHAAFHEDEHLYLSYAMLTGGPVLELGCGTGRLLLPLLEAGYQVTGVDASGEMLQRAREKLSRFPQSQYRLEQSLLTDLDCLADGTFGLAFCALNTWLHLDSPEAALSALNAAYRALLPAGLLVLDVEDPLRWTPGKGEWLLGGVWQVGAETVVKSVASVHDPASGRDLVTVLWDTTDGGPLRRTVFTTSMRTCTRGELVQMLERAGFELEDTLGSWDLDPYEGRGDRLILVARRL